MTTTTSKFSNFTTILRNSSPPLKLAGFSFAAVIVLLSLDVIKYPGFVSANFGIQSQSIALVIFLGLFFARLSSKLTIPHKLTITYSLVIVPVVLTIAVLMQLAEIFLFENVVFAYTHLQPLPFANLALILTLYWAIFFSTSIIHTHYKQLLFTSAFVALALFIFLNWRWPEAFKYLDKEDSPLEFATFFLFASASIASAKSYLLTKKQKLPKLLKKTQLFLLAAGTIGLFFVAGEEISWGQRIFNIPTPNSLLQINQQKELNIHNTNTALNYVYDAYLVLGIYGMFSWLAIYIPTEFFGYTLDRYLAPVLSHWYLAPYFTLITVYVIWRYATFDGSYDPWEETAELFLSVGVFAIFARSYLNLKTSRS